MVGGGVAYVALAADHLLAVVLGCQDLEGGLDHATSETEDQVESGLLLDVIVGESMAVLKLLSGENQALLIRGDSLLVLCISTITVKFPHLLCGE